MFRMSSSRSCTILMFCCTVFLPMIFHQCKAITCPARPELSNGRIVYSKEPLDNGRYPEWTGLRIYCNKGYFPTGVVTASCNPYRGGWSRGPVTCQATCFILSGPVNGGIIFDKSPVGTTNYLRYPVGTRAGFYCNSGYIISGGASATCRSPPGWNVIGTVSCLATCPSLSLSNGQVSYSPHNPVNGRHRIDVVASFTCNSEYSLSSSNSRTCMSSGTWNQQTPTCTKDSSGSCFPSVANVKIGNGKTVIMSELQIGDQVQTISPEGDIMYSDVKSFLKKQDTLTGMFMSVTTSLNATVRLTSNHLIYARKSCNEKFSPVYADQISCGDEVLVQENDDLVPTKIINVSSLLMEGFYAPMTKEGNILVDGVVASCYGSFDHDLAHIVMMPMQWFPDLLESIFGEDNGNSVYVKIKESFGNLVLPNGYLY